MTGSELRSIVVAGDAPTAAMAGAALAISLRNSGVRVTVVTQPGTATPAVALTGGPRSLHQLLGIDEAQIQAIASIGLGTRYRGLSPDADDIFVPLGSHGMTVRLVDFHHYVVKLRSAGEDIAYNDFSVPAACAAAGRLVMPAPEEQALRDTIGYDLYVDSAAYTGLIRQIGTEAGAQYVDAGVVSIEKAATGQVEALVLEDGERIGGELFVDCTADRVVASAASPGVEFDDWSVWLPCNHVEWSSVDVDEDPGPYTLAERTDDGWRIVMRTRIGPVAARATPGGEDPNGHYRDSWTDNCVAIGTAATRLEPIEITPMHHAQAGMRQLLKMLPRDAHSPALAAEYNRVMRNVAEEFRDYQALRHALASSPDYTSPRTLEARSGLFRRRGRFTSRENDLLGKARWVSSFMNLGAWPAGYDPLADMADPARLADDLQRFREILAQNVAKKPQ